MSIIKTIIVVENNNELCNITVNTCKGRINMKNNIKKIREAKGLSQAALAKKIGTYSQQIYRLEAKDDSLEIKWLELIAGALDVNILDLIFDEGEKMNFSNAYLNNSAVSNSGNAVVGFSEFNNEFLDIFTQLNTKNKAHIVLEIYTLLEAQKLEEQKS